MRCDRRLRLAALLLPLACPITFRAMPAHASPVPPPRQPTDIYARVETKLARDPQLAARIGQPPVELSRFAWMAGTWQVEARAVAGSGNAAREYGSSIVRPIVGGAWIEIADHYPDGSQDIGYLTYNSATRRWVSVALDSMGNANATFASGWDGDRIAFEGDVAILGLFAHLRQTLTKLSDSEYIVVNEELVGGEWRTLDEYHYRKMSSAVE